MSQSVNRRRWNRYDGHGRTQARTDPHAMISDQESGSFKDVGLLNYSRGGIDFRTDFEPRIGDRVQVRIEGTGMRPEEPVSAHVCWAARNNDGNFDAGLTFERSLSWSGY
ncbi:MAG TPA: PilZ domain-containing protein [Desulfomicrobiaceae bacterium]|nr:PilZ domain-containing protein [Desulfomicrobiaceae bacterium]